MWKTTNYFEIFFRSHFLTFKIIDLEFMKYLLIVCFKSIFLKIIQNSYLKGVK